MPKLKISYLMKNREELSSEDKLIRKKFKTLKDKLNYPSLSIELLLSLRIFSSPEVKKELSSRFPLLHFPNTGEAELLFIEHTGGLRLKQGLTNEKMLKSFSYLSPERAIRLVSFSNNLDEKIIMREDRSISFMSKTYPCTDSLLEHVCVAFSQTTFNDAENNEEPKEIGLVNLNLYHLLTGLGAY